MRTLFSLTSLLILLALVGSLTAQEQSLFDRLDKDENGFIDESEVGDDAANLFKRLLRNNDENKDGKLSRDEFKAGTAWPVEPADRDDLPLPDRLPPNFDGAAFFDQIDANSDGKLAHDELPARMQQSFARMDANSDGSVDKEEFTRAVQVMRERNAPSRAPGAPGPYPRPEHVVGAMVLKALDADGNGEISASEIADSAKVLAKFDKNEDGKLDREELMQQVPADMRPRPAPGGGAPSGLPDRLKELDANGDGKISKEEAPERMKEFFDRFDTNSDGQVDQTELRRLGDRLRPQ
jgi:Ca2+-binding EF-hand superfamily protein